MNEAGDPMQLYYDGIEPVSNCLSKDLSVVYYDRQPRGPWKQSQAIPCWLPFCILMHCACVEITPACCTTIFLLSSPTSSKLATTSIFGKIHSSICYSESERIGPKCLSREWAPWIYRVSCIRISRLPFRIRGTGNTPKEIAFTQKIVIWKTGSCNKVMPNFLSVVFLEKLVGLYVVYYCLN